MNIVTDLKRDFVAVNECGIVQQNGSTFSATSETKHGTAGNMQSFDAIQPYARRLRRTSVLVFVLIFRMMMQACGVTLCKI